MKRASASNPNLRSLTALLALSASSSVHSWIESAFKVAANGTFIGAEGFPRGYIPRSEPGFSDKQAQHQIPEGGIYKGNEVLNKFPLDAHPKHPLLEAAPGDKVAILHLENGHVTLPQNQANKPLNRGTIFLYGTSQPKDQEKLLDVHLLWNSDGSGGDKRGTLLATRNYDGQCFQDNNQQIAQERVQKLGTAGGKLEKELKCQSITIPRIAKPGSIFTVYWYWDWPTLDPAKVDMERTKQGQYPWAGSFMRGDKVPNGWTVGAIRVNESYSSVIDIKITEPLPGVVAKEAGGFIDKQDTYKMGIKDQLNDAFDVKLANLVVNNKQVNQDPAPSASTSAPPAVPVTTYQAPVPGTPLPSQPAEDDCGPLPNTTTTTYISVTHTPIPATRNHAVMPGNGATTATHHATHAKAHKKPTVTKTVTVAATTILHTVYVTAAPTAPAAVKRNALGLKPSGVLRRRSWALANGKNE